MSEGKSAPPWGKPMKGWHPYTRGNYPHPWVCGCGCCAGRGAGWAPDTWGLTPGIPYMPLHIMSIVLASTRCKKMTSLSRLFMESQTIALHFPTAFGESPDTPKSNFQLIRMCSITVNSQNAWRTLKHWPPMHVWQVPSIHCIYTDKIKLKQDKNQFSQEKLQNLSTEQEKVKAKVELLSHMASIISSTIN